MTGLKQTRSSGGKIILVGLMVALSGLIGPASVKADDRAAPSSSLFEITKTPTPSAEEAMNDAIRDGLTTSPAAAKDCARRPSHSTKKRLSVSTALKSVCADRKPDHEGAPTTEDGPSADKR
jgi:hypothetical protein